MGQRNYPCSVPAIWGIASAAAPRATALPDRQVPLRSDWRKCIARRPTSESHRTTVVPRATGVGRDVVVVVLGVQSVMLVVVRPISYLLVAFDPEKLHARLSKLRSPWSSQRQQQRGPITMTIRRTVTGCTSD
jgi:hypothetical protein